MGIVLHVALQPRAPTVSGYAFSIAMSPGTFKDESVNRTKQSIGSGEDAPVTLPVKEDSLPPPCWYLHSTGQLIICRW